LPASAARWARKPPTVILPGNHDRRRGGLFGAHDERLFHALKQTLGKRAWVHGCTTPFLSAVLPRDFHGQNFWVIARTLLRIYWPLERS
jgi:hypothetical protein